MVCYTVRMKILILVIGAVLLLFMVNAYLGGNPLG